MALLEQERKEAEKIPAPDTPVVSPRRLHNNRVHPLSLEPSNELLISREEPIVRAAGYPQQEGRRTGLMVERWKDPLIIISCNSIEQPSHAK